MDNKMGIISGWVRKWVICLFIFIFVYVSLVFL